MILAPVGLRCAEQRGDRRVVDQVVHERPMHDRCLERRGVGVGPRPDRGRVDQQVPGAAVRRPLPRLCPQASGQRLGDFRPPGVDRRDRASRLKGPDDRFGGTACPEHGHARPLQPRLAKGREEPLSIGVAGGPGPVRVSSQRVGGPERGRQRIRAPGHPERLVLERGRDAHAGHVEGSGRPLEVVEVRGFKGDIHGIDASR